MVTVLSAISRYSRGLDQVRRLPARDGPEARNLEAAAGRNRTWAVDALQRIEGGPHHVVGVGGALRLGDDVVDAEGLEHGAHRAAGDDAGAGTAARRMTRPAPCRRPRRGAAYGPAAARGSSGAWPGRSPADGPAPAGLAMTEADAALWSPTTTSAAKPKRRPPFTTLATRLMWTRRSTNSLSRSSRSPPRPPRS